MSENETWLTSLLLVLVFSIGFVILLHIIYEYRQCSNVGVAVSCSWLIIIIIITSIIIHF